MGFVDAVKSGFRNYATFKGRASRSEYWWWVLFSSLLSSAGTVIDAGVGTSNGQGSLGIFGGLISLALILPGLSVFVRRMHDVDRSGWWYFIIFTIVGIIPLFIWSVQRGNPGPNRFGADPLGGPEAPSAGYAPQPYTAAPAASQKLEELGRLRDQGLITQAEFDERRKGVLGAF